MNKDDDFSFGDIAKDFDTHICCNQVEMSLFVQS
jgi:hypothetical protein